MHSTDLAHLDIKPGNIFISHREVCSMFGYVLNIQINILCVYCVLQKYLWYVCIVGHHIFLFKPQKVWIYRLTVRKEYNEFFAIPSRVDFQGLIFWFRG